MKEKPKITGQLDKDSLRWAVDKTIEEIAQKVVKIHGPYWKGRLNLVNLLISLSSAFLVGTITFSGSLVGNAAGQTKSPWLLIISWLIILLCLVSGVLCAWFHTKLYSFHPMLFYSKAELDKRSEKLDPKSETYEQDISIIFRDISMDASKAIERADTRSFYALNVALVTFVLGILVFIVFGSVQMLK